MPLPGARFFVGGARVVPAGNSIGLYVVLPLASVTPAQQGKAEIEVIGNIWETPKLMEE